MRARFVLPCLPLLLLAPHATPQDPTPEQAPRTGAFAATYGERHPDAELRRLCARFDWTLSFVRETDPEATAYAVEDQTFQLYVPEDYDGTRPFGLLVWISPGDDGRPPGERWPTRTT